MHIDLDIIVYAVVAVVILARLWAVLGTRRDDEPQRPNPLTLPLPVIAPPPTGTPFLAGPPPASLAGGLAQVQAIDPAFDEKAFLQQARATFTAIVEAYASGALDAVADLLSPPLLAHFRQAAAARAQAGHSAQTRVLTIASAEVTAARAAGAQAFVTVTFISVQENILRDAGGAVIGGGAGVNETATDIWTFTRDTPTADSKWVVAETGG